MSYGHAMSFWRANIQIVALLVVSWDVRAQSAASVGEGRSQRGGGVLVAESFRSPVAQSNIVSPGSVQFEVGTNELFAGVRGVAAGLTTSAGFGLAGSEGFSYTAPGDTFGIFIQSTGPAITGNDLFSPFVEIMRSNLPGGAVPAAGATMDTSGANHFKALAAPHWVLCRNSRYPITVTLPVQAVAGDDPYWFGHHYGWVAGGVNVRVPLSFIPKQYGKWSAGTSADLCYYGTTTAEFAKSLGLQLPKLGAAVRLEL